MFKFNQTQSNYDRISRWYDHFEGWGERSICIEANKLMNIQSGEKILEVGSGTGANLLRIANTVNTCEIVGLDLSNKMCQQAKIKTRKIKDYPLDIVNGNAIHLPFPKNHFDVLYMLFTLEIIPIEYISFALRECRRVLKPNGRICVGAMSAEKTNHLMMRLYLALIHHFPEVVDCRPIDLETIMQNIGFKPLVNQIQLLLGLPVRILIANKCLRNEDENTNFSN
jgi:ubiquinone/menaquinone biosynthesis C-methylase UbiE